VSLNTKYFLIKFILRVILIHSGYVYV